MAQSKGKYTLSAKPFVKWAGGHKITKGKKLMNIEIRGKSLTKK